MNVLRLIDEIEQLVEEGKGFMGKRLIEEEAFFTKVQALRSALPQAMKDAATSSSAGEVAVPAGAMSRGDKLRLIAQLSAELARDEP